MMSYFYFIFLFFIYFLFFFFFAKNHTFDVITLFICTGYTIFANTSNF